MESVGNHPDDVDTDLFVRIMRTLQLPVIKQEPARCRMDVTSHRVDGEYTLYSG